MYGLWFVFGDQEPSLSVITATRTRGLQVVGSKGTGRKTLATVLTSHKSGLVGQVYVVPPVSLQGSRIVQLSVVELL
jgi:hypothetical protein